MADSDIVEQIYQYKYLYFGFDPDGESSDNLWKATPVLCGSDDAINWTLIAHLPQLGNLRDGNIAIYGDWYYLTGTIGIYRTKDFETFEELDSSFIEERDGFHDIWAPEFFVDLTGEWHLIWCANNGTRHVYVGDFDPVSGQATNTWQQVDEDGGIDPHIWTANGKYYLSIDGYWLYQSSSYMGPFELINNNMVHENVNNHWYEAGETLQIGDTLYFYMDHITGEVPGVADSGHMEVQTANINDLSSWSGPQPVSCSINMRHGSFLNLATETTPLTQPIVSNIQLSQLTESNNLNSNVASNWKQCLIALNSLNKRASSLIGDDLHLIEDDLLDPPDMMNRALYLYVDRVFKRIDYYLDDMVNYFNDAGLVDPTIGEDIELPKIIVPKEMMVDKQLINTNWNNIEAKINELFEITKKFKI